jgi:nitrogen fixation NifU-like protein
MSIYQEIILDHYRNPKNFGKIKNPTKSSSVYNPLCGDLINMDIVIKDGKVNEVKFHGQGCAISTAAASILTEYIKGKKGADLLKIDKNSMIKLVGIEVGPTRMKCLLLPLEALHKSLNG